MSQTSPASVLYGQTSSTGNLGGPSYEKVLTRKCGACGDACRTSDGSGHAGQPPPPPPVVYYDWSGAYIGFNAGSTWSHVDQTFADRRRRTGKHE